MTGAKTERLNPTSHSGLVTRFAPSPTGQLHLGHALSALTGFHIARRFGGRFLIRIEDIDPDRCRPDLIGESLEILRWLGLTWEEPVLQQAHEMPVYEAAARQLSAMGLLYPCFASRSEIEASARPGDVDPDGAPIYPGLHKHLTGEDITRRKAAGQPFAMRLDMQKAIAAAVAKAGTDAFGYTEVDANLREQRVAIDPLRWGDAVIQRKAAPTSYHLSVVVDDARQGVTLVTRGVDLKPATDIHRLLQVLLGLSEPLYHHHPLLLGPNGKKLSKRDNATSLAALRAQGVTAAEIRSRLGF